MHTNLIVAPTVSNLPRVWIFPRIIIFLSRNFVLSHPNVDCLLVSQVANANSKVSTCPCVLLLNAGAKVSSALSMDLFDSNVCIVMFS